MVYYQLCAQPQDCARSATSCEWSAPDCALGLKTVHGLPLNLRKSVLDLDKNLNLGFSKALTVYMVKYKSLGDTVYTRTLY
jgi:hypothetical protein